MRLTPFLVASLVAIVMPFLSARADEPGNPLPETRIVLRMSRKFIQGLLGERFQRNEPVRTNVDGIDVTGTAHASGTLRVRLHESDTEGNFDVLVRGEVLSELTATSPPVVVLTHGTAPFSVRQPIRHQGNQFVEQELTMDVRNHFTLDDIGSFRGGLTGALTRRIARPFVRRGLANGNSQADEKIRTEMTPVLKAELGKLVTVLNSIPPLVEKAYDMVILENKTPPDGVRFYRAATKDHLLISIGKPNQRIPTLPNLDKDQQAPLELWIAVSRRVPAEERRKFVLENWHFITPLLRPTGAAFTRIDQGAERPPGQASRRRSGPRSTRLAHPHVRRRNPLPVDRGMKGRSSLLGGADSWPHRALHESGVCSKICSKSRLALAEGDHQGGVELALRGLSSRRRTAGVGRPGL